MRLSYWRYGEEHLDAWKFGFQLVRVRSLSDGYPFIGELRIYIRANLFRHEFTLYLGGKKHGHSKRSVLSKGN